LGSIISAITEKWTRRQTVRVRGRHELRIECGAADRLVAVCKRVDRIRIHIDERKLGTYLKCSKARTERVRDRPRMGGCILRCYVSWLVPPRIPEAAQQKRRARLWETHTEQVRRKAGTAAEPGDMTQTNNMNGAAERWATATTVECGRPGPEQLAGRGGPIIPAWVVGKRCTRRAGRGGRTGSGTLFRPLIKGDGGGVEAITGGGGAGNNASRPQL
jgi:hypothetical protein